MEDKNKITYFSDIFNVDFTLLKEVSSKIEWDEGCYLIDKWSFMDDIYKPKMFRIDDFPKTIPIEGRHSQLELFFIKDDEINPTYLEKEKKFLMVLSKLWAYSLTYVESSIFFDAEFSHKLLDDKKFELVKQMFSKESIIAIDNWEILRFLFILSLRNYISTCVYLVDLKIIVWVEGICCVVYLCDKNQEDFVKTICTTEGLYLYSKGE